MKALDDISIDKRLLDSVPRTVFSIFLAMVLSSCVQAQECLEVPDSLLTKINFSIYINSSPDSIIESVAVQSALNSRYFLVGGELDLNRSSENPSKSIATWVVDDLNNPTVILSVDPTAEFHSKFPTEDTEGFFFFGDENFGLVRKCLLQQWGKNEE